MDQPIFQIKAKPVPTKNYTGWRPAILIIVDGVVQRHLVNENKVTKRDVAMRLSNQMAEQMENQIANDIFMRLVANGYRNSN